LLDIQYHMQVVGHKAILNYLHFWVIGGMVQ
jgi:hypothetical protein